MGTDLAAGVPAGPAVPRHPGRPVASVVARWTARRSVRSGALWGYVFGLYVASQAFAYVAAYDPAQRAKLAATFGNDAAVSAIAGPAREIQTVGGLVVWKSLAVLSVVGAVWGLLAATRLLRGEEDAGRWELLLSGGTTRRGATAQVLAGLGAGFAALWAVTSAIVVAVGRSSRIGFTPSAAVFLATSLAASAAVFLAVGALASQLATSRRQAAGVAGAFLGVSYAIRMVADSAPGLAWLRWATPLGWMEDLQPMTSPRPLVLVPIVGLVALLVALTVHLAGTRDLGAGLFPSPDTARPRTGLLSGPAGLTARLVRPTVSGWAAGIAAGALIVGVVSKQAGGALAGSSSIERVISRLGVPGASAESYLGVCFLIVAVLVALVAAGQVTAARGEEAEGRLDHLLVRLVSRRGWLAARLSVATAVLVGSGLLAGLFAWFGAAVEHAGVGLASVLEAGLNVVPPALCILGVGVLVMGVRPRATTVATYGLLAWSFLVQLVGTSLDFNHWLLDTSVFHQVAAAPAVPPDWGSAAVLVAVGVAAAALGGLVFGRRDLAGE